MSRSLLQLSLGEPIQKPFDLDVRVSSWTVIPIGLDRDGTNAGTLHTGIFAIGGETTGTTITAKGITWELQLGESLAYERAAERLHGKKVILRGNLERRRSVEIKGRWIVTVTELQAVDAAGIGGSSQSRLIATVGRADTRIRFVSEPKTTIVDIVSGFGIVTATIKRESDSWPESIVVRLHLKGLGVLQSDGRGDCRGVVHL